MPSSGPPVLKAVADVYFSFQERADPTLGTMSEHHRQVPVLRVTSETEEAPSPPSEESPTKAPVHPRLQFVRDEDANSTAPLLDSGSSTPVCEEPRTPLTLGSFLSSAAAASSGAAAGDDYEEEEIGMRSLSSADARLGQLPCSDRLAGPMAGPLGRWPWRLLRGLAAASALAAIVACCAVAAALIALLPDKCDPPTAWWQGAAFYTWRHAVDGHPLDDWNDADRFRWLDRQLHVDVVRIDSVLQQQQQRQQQQRQERKRFGFFFLFVFFLEDLLSADGNGTVLRLVEWLEERNMSLVVDVDVRPYVGSGRLDEGRHRAVEQHLLGWLHQGVHGLYLQVRLG